MKEELLVTARSNPLVDPDLGIWTWEVAMYLFMGGLAAGCMLFAALATLLRKDRDAPFASTQLALLGPVVLSLGMTTLFLDLEYKLQVFRFYTSFQPTSPMSWGSWILVIIYPVSLLQILSTLRLGFPAVADYADRVPLLEPLVDFCERHRRAIAALVVPFAIALGIYTGILLSAFGARPFWNSGVLGPLFLVSGMSTAAALVALLARDHAEKALFVRVDLVLIVVEIALVGLFLLNLATGSGPQIDALHSVMGGPYTMVFWVLFVGIGLLLPLLLEVVEISGGARAFAVLAPVLVLVGGYALRQILLDIGQESSWTHYESQYSAELLERLR